MGCGGSKAHKPTQAHFADVSSIWEALADGSVRLLRATWLIRLAKDRGVLARRQDLPEEAFICAQELMLIHKKSNARAKDEARNWQQDVKRAPVVAVSYFWRTKDHPDPAGETLQLVAEKLEVLMTQRAPQCNFGKSACDAGMSELGVFFDFGSLFQALRNEEEFTHFKRSLAHINLWYAHALTTVIAVTETPEDIDNYFKRGWCVFEYQLALLLIPSDSCNVWPQLIDVGKQRAKRPPLAGPDAFSPGYTQGDLRFTNGNDRDMVARKWREAVEIILASETYLDFQGSGWTDDDMEALGLCLPLCQNLERVDLGFNPFTKLPQSVSSLQHLKCIDLRGTGVIELPESLAELPKLSHILVAGCEDLRPLPPCFQRKGLDVEY